MKKKNQNGVLEYLQKTGVLSSGTPEAIALARKAYWKNYKVQWRKQRRLLCKEYSVSFDPKQTIIIQRSAKSHQSTIPKFIRDVTIAYCIHQILIPNTQCYNEIRQLLIQNYTTLQNIEEKNGVIDSQLLQQFKNLEDYILATLNKPYPLAETIKSELTDNPNLKPVIQEILNSISDDH